MPLFSPLRIREKNRLGSDNEKTNKLIHAILYILCHLSFDFENLSPDQTLKKQAGSLSKKITCKGSMTTDLGWHLDQNKFASGYDLKENPEPDPSL